MSDWPDGIYPWLSLGISIFVMILTCLYAQRMAFTYKKYHDERAAIGLAKGVGLLVMSFGLLVGSVGLIANNVVISATGGAITRGCFLALMLTLILAGVRPGEED